MSNNTVIPHEDTDVGKVQAWLDHFSKQDGEDDKVRGTFHFTLKNQIWKNQIRSTQAS